MTSKDTRPKLSSQGDSQLQLCHKMKKLKIRSTDEESVSDNVTKKQAARRRFSSDPGGKLAYCSYRKQTDHADVFTNSKSSLPSQQGKRMSRAQSYLEEGNAARSRFAQAAMRVRVGLSVSNVFYRMGADSRRGADDVTPRVENTYKLEPDKVARFTPLKVEECLHSLLEEYLSGRSYSGDSCSKLAPIVANLVKEQIKSLHFDRHKIVCHVTLGERRGQSVEVASRCLWLPESDNYATARYVNDSLVAIATVFACYSD